MKRSLLHDLIVSFVIVSLVTVFSSAPPYNVETAYADSTILYPAADVDITTWRDEAGGSTNIYQSISEGTTSYNDNNFVNSGANSTSSYDISLTGAPADVGTVTQIIVRFRGSETPRAKGQTITVYYCASAGCTPTTQIGTAQAMTLSWAPYSVTASGLSLNKTSLDNLKLRFMSAASAGNSLQISAAQVDVTYTPAAPVSISLTTNGAASLGTMELNTTQDTTASGTNDPETVIVNSGPADLAIRSSAFTDGTTTWTFGSSNGNNQAVWQFSKDGSNWNTFSAPNTNYTFDTNVAQSSTRNIYLKLTTPTGSNTLGQFSSTVTIVATSPQ